jgi:hypothetical protein
MRQRLHASLTVHDNERTGVGTGATEYILVQRADVDSDDQTTQNVEQAQANPDRSDRFRDRATRVFGFGCDETGVLTACHGEDAGWHDAEEAFEAVQEGRFVPVAEADGFGGCAAGGDDLLNMRVVSVSWSKGCDGSLCMYAQCLR